MSARPASWADPDPGSLYTAQGITRRDAPECACPADPESYRRWLRHGCPVHEDRDGAACVPDAVTREHAERSAA